MLSAETPSTNTEHAGASAAGLNDDTSTAAGARGPSIDPGILAAMLAIVRERTGVDFSAYRPAMLQRRILNQIASSGASSARDYLDLLQVSAVEAFRLLERITIKVSRFYRHAPAFDYLRDTLLPALAKARAGEPLRIWCAGCGSGEEAYTFAMLLEEAGIAGSIEASDIDASALNAARIGAYPVAAAAELPAALAARFVEPVILNGAPGFRIHDDLRARVKFTCHDITGGGAMLGNARFDLVSCRNVLIYLQRSAQHTATRRLLDMTREGGVLCLGEAEWPVHETMERLEALPHKTRLFRIRAERASNLQFLADHELNREGFRARS